MNNSINTEIRDNFLGSITSVMDRKIIYSVGSEVCSNIESSIHDKLQIEILFNYNHKILITIDAQNKRRRFSVGSFKINQVLRVIQRRKDTSKSDDLKLRDRNKYE